jgi:hypothetical protein
MKVVWEIVKKETGKYSTEEETLLVYINDNIMKNYKLTANPWSAYFLTTAETVNNVANIGDTSLM